MARMSVVGAATFAGLAGAALLVAGCGNTTTAVSATAPVTTPVTSIGAAKTVYVVQQPAGGAGSILEFSATASGIVSPTGTLPMPSGFTATAVAIDGTGEIYVGGTGSSGPSVLVYAAGAVGAQSPVRTLLANGNFATPVAITIGAGELYVLGGAAVAGGAQSVAAYAETATGAAAAVRVLAGSLTQIGTAVGLAADGSGDIFVTNSDGTTSSVLVFNATAVGNVAPTSKITSGNGVVLAGLQGAVADGNGNVFVVNNPASGPPATIAEYSGAATGNALVAKTIGAAALANSAGLTLDGVGNLFVVSSSSTVAPYGLTVLEFQAGASGNVSPNSILSSASWTDPGTGQVAVY